jgi:hypothetical protein
MDHFDGLPTIRPGERAQPDLLACKSGAAALNSSATNEEKQNN